MNIEEPGLDTYKVGTVEAPSGGDVSMHTIEGQVAVIIRSRLCHWTCPGSDMARRGAAGRRLSISVTGLCRWPAK